MKRLADLTLSSVWTLNGLFKMIDNEKMVKIFGSNARGDTLEEYAANSENKYVRSQVQLAIASEQAKGRKITAKEALDLYGLDILEKVAVDGSAPLVNSRDEPANTLRRRREDLKLDIRDIEKLSGLDTKVLKNLETPGKASKIRDIERVASLLALDERIVGFREQAGGDRELGVRLRELRSTVDAKTFDASSVLKLAEAGWIVSRQNELGRVLKIDVHPIVAKGTLQSDDYSYVSAEKGYALAEKARAELGLKPDEPIVSIRELLERKLGVPLVQDKLTSRFAGATIANGSNRGIVVNEAGQNEKVWVRRMTLAHEIGHLVGDPDQRLNKLRVDSYDSLKGLANEADNVERRANGFAVAFLAPPSAVRAIAQQKSTSLDILETVMNTFGVSMTAAAYHIQNIAKLDVSSVHPRDIKDQSQEWVARENLTLDYFPINETPLNRRGRFASLVVRAEKLGHISDDTAATWLNTTVEKYCQASSEILELQE